ncbi:MAG: hypothetical protein M1834_009426 [Cirrosporium novae-zelandiae]|nr:MAG: hypothetical protein M1834_009426 [Cirrosporium novae-zelandiae]
MGCHIPDKNGVSKSLTALGVEIASGSNIAVGASVESSSTETSHFESLSRDYSNEAHDPYWRKVPCWSNVTEKEFLSYQWQIRNSVLGNKPALAQARLKQFLEGVLPTHIPHSETESLGFASKLVHIRTREDFIHDVMEGISAAPMSIRLTPHILSVIDWSNPLQDPVLRQFIPINSARLPDHPMLTLDSLHETEDSPTPGLVHRYPSKALFLSTSICPVYCRFCTRSYAVGLETESVETKAKVRFTKDRENAMFEYIENTPALNDIVVSGGDSYLLDPRRLVQLGERLLNIPHIKRFRLATKGLAVCPSRIVDDADVWADALIHVVNKGRERGVAVAVHTHFNHSNEITWITRLAAEKLFRAGVTVRNQSVLLRGVNNDLDTMKKLIQDLADMNIQPYYVYQGDMVKGVEDLRTPLQEILDLEHNIRGTIAGFMTPSFVVDLPGGGGKRLATSYETYDKKTGISTFRAPGVKGKDRIFSYYDPEWSLPA